MDAALKELDALLAAQVRKPLIAVPRDLVVRLIAEAQMHEAYDINHLNAHPGRSYYSGEEHAQHKRR